MDPTNWLPFKFWSLRWTKKKGHPHRKGPQGTGQTHRPGSILNCGPVTLPKVSPEWFKRICHIRNSPTYASCTQGSTSAGFIHPIFEHETFGRFLQFDLHLGKQRDKLHKSWTPLSRGVPLLYYVGQTGHLRWLGSWATLRYKEILPYCQLTPLAKRQGIMSLKTTLTFLAPPKQNTCVFLLLFSLKNQDRGGTVEKGAAILWMNKILFVPLEKPPVC